MLSPAWILSLHYQEWSNAMASDSAIADVGQTLIDVLRDRMGDLVDQNEIALASPSTIGNGNEARLTLFLYRITENAELKNARRHTIDPTSTGDPPFLRPSPLALDLYYLLTAHPATGGNDETERSGEQHLVLGRAVQVLRDNAIFRGSELRGSLAYDPETEQPEEEVRITVAPTDSPSMDDLVNIWGTFPDQPFQPSISYLVSPVRIDSERERPIGRVVEKHDEYYRDLDDRRQDN